MSVTSAEVGVQNNQLCQSCEWKLTYVLLLTEDPKHLSELLYSRRVLPKSVVCECRNPVTFYANKSDCWNAYNFLETEGFQNLSVNH
jgi:hypothetical protein